MTSKMLMAATMLSGFMAQSAFAVDAAAVKQCEAVAGISKGTMKVTKASLVEQPLTAQQAQGNAAAGDGAATSVTFCRVEVTTTPAAGAEIKTEVWLPTKDKWNGRMLGTGNGGAAGSINYGTLIGGLAMGYAVTNTDVGTHVTGGGGAGGDVFKFGFNPELRTNYVWRGVHEMTLAAKKAVTAYYGKPQEKAIFAGCSTGGGEAAAEVQRFPEDYDGVLMGSPSINFGPLGLFQGYSYAATHQTPAHNISSKKLPAIGAEVLRQCDMLDGVADNVTENPRICKFDPKKMACSGTEDDMCLTPPQIEALTKIYSDLKHPRTGQIIYRGLQPGAEGAPAAKVRISNESVGSVINPTMAGALGWVLGPDWKPENWLTFDWDKGTDDLLKKVAPYSNDSTDIRPFINRGGKLIMWAGWGDPNFPQYNTAHYYEEAAKTAGARAPDSMRLYLAPGVGHCGGGQGPNQLGQSPSTLNMKPSHNLILALDEWVSKGTAPKEIIATKYSADDLKVGYVARTRPVCPYPQVAKWDGKSSTYDHTSFSCVKPD